MSDAEFFLLGWAVLATVLAIKWHTELGVIKKMFMHFVRDKNAREVIVKQWEEFKKQSGV